VDQHLDNTRNEFLWTLLANPANDAHLYTFNLQRLVNDFPQSGILQALLAHASDEKNLRQASVYFNPKSLYKLINAPSTFIGVPDERIVIQPGIASNGHYYHEASPSLRQYDTEKVDEVYFNEPPADAEQTFTQTTDIHEPVAEDHTEHHLNVEEVIAEHTAPVIETAENIYVEEDAHAKPEAITSVAEEALHEHQPHIEPVAAVPDVIEEKIHEETPADAFEHHAEPETLAISHDVAAEESIEEQVAHHPENHLADETPEPVTGHHEPQTYEEAIAVDPLAHYWNDETQQPPVAGHDENKIREEAINTEQETHEWVEETTSSPHEHEEVHVTEAAVADEQGEHPSTVENPPPVQEHEEIKTFEEPIAKPVEEEAAAEVNEPVHADLRETVEQPAQEQPVLEAEHDEVSAEVSHEQAEAEHPVIAQAVHEETVPHVANTTHSVEDAEETYDEIVGIEDINFAANDNAAATGSNFFSFDKEFGEHADEEAENETHVQNTPSAEAVKSAAPGEADHQDVSKYHDEKMPYSFMWWLDKTRKEHSQLYQPYVKAAAAPPVKKTKKLTDELQQQYFENIFHITSVEELDKTAAPTQAPYNVRRKEHVIIERFIKEEPQIRPQSSDKLDNENKAKKSSEDRDELVTETLAAIYSDQMLYHKAIASYKKLMLKFPEKSRYFADKIEQLEKKTN